MCGRFAITLPDDAMATLFEAVPSNDLPRTPNYNVCPTNQIHVVTAGETGRRLVLSIEPAGSVAGYDAALVQDQCCVI